MSDFAQIALLLIHFLNKFRTRARGFTDGFHENRITNADLEILKGRREIRTDTQVDTRQEIIWCLTMHVTKERGQRVLND